jgi:hypothetical protein
LYIKDNIFEWGENFVQDHPNCTFEELGQAFCKQFKIVKNDEEVYMQLRNIQQEIVEPIEIYYECLLKLANYLQVKVIDVFLIIVFRIGLLPYLRLITSMKRDTLIEHKEVVIAHEESGHVSLSYNVPLITLEANIIVKLIVSIITTKLTSMCTNCRKTCHNFETRHNWKKRY